MSWYITNLADVLRDAGLNVVELPDWQSAAYPKWGGYTYPGTPNSVMVHHTASQTTPANDLAYITTMALAPLCNLYLDRDGTYTVVAAGRVCTNGAGSSAAWGSPVPDDMMNHYAIGIEAANNGTGEPWPTAQTDAYVTGCAALCAGFDIPVDHVRGHFEWGCHGNVKIDPAGPSPWATGTKSWDMDKFRAAVAAELVRQAATHIGTGTDDPPPPPEEDDVSIKILRSMSNPPEFNAQFVAVVDAAGHSIEVLWSGNGADPKVVSHMQHLRDAGIQDQHITLAGLRDNVLHPKNHPVDIQDSLHTWTDDDFAG